MKEENLKKNTLLITGGLGFIGSHFVEFTLRSGYRIVNIDKVTYASQPHLNDYFFKKYPNRYHFIKQDINNLKELPYCHYVVHFAAESHVDNSIRDSKVFMKSNVLGTKNLLDLILRMRHKNIVHDWNVALPTFLYIGTDEIFGDRAEGFFRETDRYNPSNPYAASKAAAEMFVISYGKTYGLPYKITRTTNNYGPHQHPEKLIPACITNLLHERKVKIQGSGHQIRNWIHVEDNCRAIFEVMTKGTLNEIYHISSCEEFSVEQVAREILNYFRKPFTIDTVEYIQDRSGQDLRYAIDSSKIKKLGWAPKHTLRSSLPAIIHHYEKNLDKYAARES